MQLRRKPNGKYTKSLNAYLRAWHSLGAKACKHFPGYKLSAFDPGILLTNKQWKTLSLTTEQAICMR